MKKIAIYSAAAAGLYFLFSKGRQLYAVLKNIDVKVIGIRDIKIGLKQSTVILDVELINTGNIPIDINTAGLAVVQRLSIYSSKGTLIGVSELGKTSLSIPVGGKQTIKNIPTVLYSAYVLEAMTDFENIADVRVTVDIEINGKTITV